MNTQATKIVTSLAFLATIVLANWSLSKFGLVPLPIVGLMVPAGVYFAGLSFGLRDACQEVGGRLWTIGLIVVGAALSALIDPTFALASGCAFLLSELVDFAIYTPLRERQFALGVALSNLAGSIVDSVLFLWLAFGVAAVTVEGVAGMVIGKAVMILPALVIVWWVRQRRVAVA
jgi:hypothetical protein